MNTENLFKALGFFIEGLRMYVVTFITKHYGEEWSNKYYESLTYTQKEKWDIAIKNGGSPESLIDFHNLKGFSLTYKEKLFEDFGKKRNSLPTWFEEIADARHKCQHYQDIDSEEINRAYSNMIVIAKNLKMTELEDSVTALRNNKPTTIADNKAIAEKKKKFSGELPWFLNVTPHLDIRQGSLDESVFAANLAEVAFKNGREVYSNPTIFFSKTYFTAGLTTISKRVIKGLNGEEDAENRVISLQTGFGGGKTHTLIALYHLASWGLKAQKSSDMQSVFSNIGKPNFESANVAVFTNTTNDPVQGRETGGIKIKTIWGELAYQLGGKEAYEIIRRNDEERTSPKGLFKKVLDLTSPSLILVDELADYCSASAAVVVGSSTLSDQTISFIQELTEAVSSTDKCVLVATLPASVVEVGNTQKAGEILNALQNRLGRIGSDTKPVADEEIGEVIRRRLFEDIGDKKQIEDAVSAYTNMYFTISDEFPVHAHTQEYKDRLQQSYPFHPELIDMFKIRWASHNDFQRTRGVLRLLAAIVSDLWKRQNTLAGSHLFIHSSDVFFENLDPLSGQLKKLFGNGYDAVLSGDVSGASSNAFKIDKGIKELGKYNLTQGTASTILLASFGGKGANQGLDIKQVKLAVVKPDSFNHNTVNSVLDQLEENAYYLHYSIMAGLKRYWFEVNPNLNILVNHSKSDIAEAAIKAEILNRIELKKSNMNNINVLVNPCEDIPEQKQPTLIMLGPDYQANPEKINGKVKAKIKKIAAKRGNKERVYRNTVFFLIPTEVGYSKLNEDLKNHLACIKIRDEYKNQLDDDQKSDLRQKIEKSSKDANTSLSVTYSLIVKYSSKNGVEHVLLKNFKDTIDAQVNSNIIQTLKDEEWLLDRVGINLLAKNSLMPKVGQPLRTVDIYEAFIRFDDKPMVSGVNAVKDSLLRFCYEGQIVIAAGDGKDFTKMYFKENVPFFDVMDESYWILDKNQYVKEEDKVSSPIDEYGKPTQDTPTNPETPKPEDEPKTQNFEKKFKSLNISGKVGLENYNQIFSSFIQPLVNNKLEIRIEIKGTSTDASPITENSLQYKITKESASQLGLKFEEEE